MLDDEDLVERVLDEQEGSEKSDQWRPGNYDWSLLHELAAEQRDVLTDIAVILAHGLPGDKRKFAERFPRPITKMDRARQRRKAAEEKRYDEDLLAFIERGKENWRRQQAQLKEADGGVGEVGSTDGTALGVEPDGPGDAPG